MPIPSRSSANISIKEIVPFDRLSLEFPDTCPPSLVGIMSDLEYVTVIKMINDEKPKMLKKIKGTQNILTVWLIFSFTIGILIAPFVKISLHKQKKAVLKFWENVNSLLIKSNAELFEERFLRWTLKKNEANELEDMDLWNPVYCYHLEIVYDPPRVTAAVDFVNLASIALDSVPPTAATASIAYSNGYGNGSIRNRLSSNTMPALIDLQHQSESSSRTESLKSDEEGSELDGFNNSEVIVGNFSGSDGFSGGSGGFSGGSGAGSGDVGDISTSNSLSDINDFNSDINDFNSNDNNKNRKNNQNNNNAGLRIKETEAQRVQLMEEHAKRKEKRRIRREILLSSLQNERRDLELEREAAICRLDQLKRMMMSPSRLKALPLPPLPIQISPSPSSSSSLGGGHLVQSPGSSSTASIIVPRKKFVK